MQSASTYPTNLTVNLFHAHNSQKSASPTPIEELLMQSGDAAAAGDPASEAQAELFLGDVQQKRGNIEKSIGHLRRARALYGLVHDYGGIASSELLQGQNYRNIGQYDHAVDALTAALSIAQKYGLRELQADASVMLGLLYLEVGQYTQAHQSLDYGLVFARRLHDAALREHLVHMAVDGMVNLQLQQKRPTHAWMQTMVLWKRSQQTDKPLYIGIANRAVGQVIAELGTSPYPSDFSPDAQQYFNEAIRIFDSINAEVELAHTLFTQARYLQNSTAASRSLQKAVRLYTRLGMVVLADHAAEQLGRHLG